MDLPYYMYIRKYTLIFKELLMYLPVNSIYRSLKLDRLEALDPGMIETSSTSKGRQRCNPILRYGCWLGCSFCYFLSFILSWADGTSYTCSQFTHQYTDLHTNKPIYTLYYYLLSIFLLSTYQHGAGCSKDDQLKPGLVENHGILFSLT